MTDQLAQDLITAALEFVQHQVASHKLLCDCERCLKRFATLKDAAENYKAACVSTRTVRVNVADLGSLELSMRSFNRLLNKLGPSASVKDILNVNPMEMRKFGQICFVEVFNALLKFGFTWKEIAPSIFFRSAPPKWRYKAYPELGIEARKLNKYHTDGIK